MWKGSILAQRNCWFNIRVDGRPAVEKGTCTSRSSVHDDDIFRAKLISKRFGVPAGGRKGVYA